MKRLSLLLFLLTALPAVLFAQEETAFVRKREPFVRQHELRLTAGAYPVLPYMAEQVCHAGSPTAFDRICRGPLYTDGAWSLSYDYRFRKWLDAGLTLGYYGEYSSSFRYSHRNEAWSYIGGSYEFCLTVMPVVRFTWLNRKWVRMYSTVGLGVSFEFGHDACEATRFRETLAVFQLTPVGISVGRSLFGFAEAGFGVQGALMVGIGYKFKPKNNPTK